MEAPLPAVMVVPDWEPIPKDPFVSDLKLLVVPASKNNDVEQVDAKVITVGPFCDVQTLKRHISDVFRAAVTDMTLYFQNCQGAHSQRLELLDDGYSLKNQGVTTGATVVCQLVAWDRPTSKLGESAYYMWAADQRPVPDEIRVQGGGPPVCLQAQAVVSDVPVVQRRSIKNYSWVDESRRQVKLYITAEGEPLAVAAAGTGDETRLSIDLRERRLELTIKGEGATYVLSIEELEHKIVPAESKVKVVPGKRITVTLTKANEDTLWNTLIRRK